MSLLGLPESLEGMTYKGVGAPSPKGSTWKAFTQQE